MPLNTTESSGLSVTMQTYYDKLLLIRTVPILLHGKFGQRRNIPRNNGKIIDFRKFSALPTATTPLTEGVLYTDLKELSMTNLQATIAQYGDAIGFSDLVSTTTLDPILTETTELLAEQAGESLDEIMRDVINAGTNVQYASSATTRATVTAAMTLTVAEIREAILTLRINRARKIGGVWNVLTHVRTSYDVQGTTEWVTANNEQQTGRVFDGSLGMLYGAKFWETDKAKVWVDEGDSSTVDVYSSLFFGKDAYGVVSLAGHNLRSIFKPLGSAGTADALEVQQTMAWKAAMVTKILDDTFMVRVEHATSTGDNA
jgi:N4-gp56 family major capsid protein